MERAEIKHLIMGEIKKVRKDMPDFIPPDDQLMQQWGFESIDMVELIARAEQYFKVEIADSIWKQLTTVNAMSDYIYENINTGR
jgi:acyl carrier protein